MSKSLFKNKPSLNPIKSMSKDEDDITVERQQSLFGEKIVVKSHGEVISDGKVASDASVDDKVRRTIEQMHEEQLDRELSGETTKFDRDHPNAFVSDGDRVEYDDRGRPLPDLSKIKDEQPDEGYVPRSFRKYM